MPHEVTTSDLETMAREQFSRSLRDKPDPASLDLNQNMAESYGLTSLNKVLFLTSLCKVANIDLGHFAEEDFAAMRTLADVVATLAPYWKGSAQ
ncbi:hypothetical protein [Natronoglycomyces albus]|uniref:Carrier domain-containing protein n=1 Tax=Natronoglycomyces albus TaxID=2811108 RepID=A0A895XTR4_9ACTN|nr:hypothetical protein [Natronoglycomyces albus]QSB06873.1 hypothetical protein JQS30_08300 [Natronoglycomyces albus]